jgi:multimeric flavodoxin WrbA
MHYTVVNRSLFIIGIQGSPRGDKSRTRKLVKWILDGASEAGARVTLIDITDYSIIPCIACETCYATGRCIHEDDLFEILRLISSADGLVLGSPVYLDQISGQMKIFLDRLADAIHYQILGDRYGCSVATTYTSGGSQVVSYLDHVINYLGAIAIEGFSIQLEDDPQAILQAEPVARDLGRNLVQAIRERPDYPAQERELLENREFFRSIVEKHRKTRPEEYDRWVRSGWIK